MAKKTSDKTSDKAKLGEASPIFQLGGAVPIDRLKEIFSKDEQVEFQVVARRPDRNVATDLAQSGRKE